MTILLVAIATMVGSGVVALLVNGNPRLTTLFGVGGIVAGSALGLLPAVTCLLSGSVESVEFPWRVPGGSFHVQVDPLAAFFLVPIFALSSLAAFYGSEYLQAYRNTNRLAPHWFFLNLFVASMALVVVSRNAVLFLVSWEIMSIAAFFLVTFEHEKLEVRVAGWIYLVATHLGAAFLLAMFLLLGKQANSLDFDLLAVAGRIDPVFCGIVFVLALIGFGAKAGFVPMHVWLPEAHPAAPSHISALMSGVMIKIGLYGILRTMTFLGQPASWWGPTLIAIGFAGGLLGISLALFQRDLKRSLAYSSIENIGLITLALGVGLWGITSGHNIVAVLALTGSMLHIWNHAMMKGLMFFCSGSVLHGTGTKNLERLGGLLKRMPRTGTAMIVGALAISAVPPLNGFVSEWLIYMSMLHGGLEFTGIGRIVLLLAVGGLALVGGLTLICFVRLIGIALLGTGRSDEALDAHESGNGITIPLGILALLCVALAAFPSKFVAAISSPIHQVFGVATDLALPSTTILGTLNIVVWISIAVVALFLALMQKRHHSVSGLTWDCGYIAPTARMQYTGQSFSEFMVSRLFPRSLRPKTSESIPQGLFPTEARLSAEFNDPLSRSIYRPFFDRWAERLAQLRWVQQGKIHYYLLYFVVVLVLAFGWLVLRQLVPA